MCKIGQNVDEWPLGSLVMSVGTLHRDTVQGKISVL